MENEKQAVFVPLVEPSAAGVNGRGCGIQPKSNKSWRVTLFAGVGLAGAVLTVNIVVLVWAVLSFDDHDGVATLFTGSCATTKRIVLWTHLAINILGTLLLAASNNCAQLISSPTRIEIEQAHAKWQWLDIGVPGLRNLKHISKWRILLCLLLGISSVPLHLLYNSVIFGSLSANTYEAALVTTEFLEGAWWNETRAFWTGSVADNVKPIRHLQQHASELKRLENVDCLRAYATSRYESDWASVLVITSLKSKDNLFMIWEYNPWGGGYASWMCHPHYGTEMGCDIQSLIANAANWTIPHVDQCGTVDGGYEENCNTFPAPVEYCLAKPFPAQCKIRISTALLSAVIACNVIKLVCLLSTAFLRDFEPLTTVGDAVSSFLEHPETLTAGMGPVSGTQIRSKKFKRRLIVDENSSSPFKRQPRRWANALSVTRGLVCISICSIFWVGGLALFFVSIKFSGSIGWDWSKLRTQGFGRISQADLFGGWWHAPLTANVLVINFPQLAASILYLLYNSAFTSMLSAYEYGIFGSQRKPLRVSMPRGEQRATFWLQIPYRYILPLMTASALLHWLISRSLFLVQLNFTYPHSFQRDYVTSVTSCGYSPLAILLAVTLGGAMILVLLGTSLRKLDAGIPVAGSCSLAISAAAHPGNIEDNAAFLPVMYGVIQEDYSTGRNVQRVGFSSKEVGPLVNGVSYS